MSLECDREDCYHTGGRGSDTYGYICYDCFDELVSRGIIPVEGFMASPKQGQQSEAVEAYYNEIFKRLNDD